MLLIVCTCLGFELQELTKPKVSSLEDKELCKNGPDIRNTPTINFNQCTQQGQKIVFYFLMSSFKGCLRIGIVAGGQL